jgi:hypothetical protein
MPGLYEGLLQTPPIITVQGRLEPMAYGGGDFARHVTVYTIGDLGGPQLVARFANGERLSDDDLLPETVHVVGMIGTLTYTPSPSPIPSETAVPSPTPGQIMITVTQAVVNLRAGPGTEFERVGQLEQGQRAPVVGANRDYTWLVIQYRGSVAWVAANIVEIFDPGGQLLQLPIIEPSPVVSPTVGPPPTQPVAGIDLLIDTVVLNPAQPVPGQPFTAEVYVRNQGGVAAGAFSVAATFQPGAVQVSSQSPGLGAGQSVIMALSATVPGSGVQAVGVTVDAANSVPESNEGNNIYPLSYRVDFPIAARVDLLAMPLNMPFDMAGGTTDLLWTGGSMDGQNGALLGVIFAPNYDAVFYDTLDPALITNASLPESALPPGALVGVITAEGRRGVFRIDNRAGTSLTISYRVYSI